MAQCETAFLCSTARLDRIPRCLLAAAAMASSSDRASPLPPGSPPGTTQGLPLEEVMPKGAILSVEELPDWDEDTEETEDSCQEGDIMIQSEPPRPEGGELQNAVEEFKITMAARKYAASRSPLVLKEEKRRCELASRL